MVLLECWLSGRLSDLLWVYVSWLVVIWVIFGEIK